MMSASTDETSTPNKWQLQQTNKCEQGESLPKTIESELDRLGANRRWVWMLFLIGTLPNILNGFHVSSYVFVGRMPDEYWCEVTALRDANWTRDNVITISTGSIDGINDNACTIFDYDYPLLATMEFERAIEYIRTLPQPVARRSCLAASSTASTKPTSVMRYTLDGTSIVAEWDLVCENSVWRTVVQMIISLGKCLGAVSVGIASDRYGRRKLFAYGAILFTIASLLTTFSPWYWLFLVGRFGLGKSSSGLFYPAVIMMTENVVAKHRSWIGIAFNIAYPVGMLYLALAAYFLIDWRHLQLALTIPVIFLPAFWYFFNESPRWLLSKGRLAQAYRVVFGKKLDSEAAFTRLSHVSPGSADPETENDKTEMQANSTVQLVAAPKSSGMFSEIRGLYSTAKSARTAIICHFSFFIASFSYYVTALNATNLSSNRNVYVAATGCVDILAYLCGIVLISTIGRKWGCFSSFALAGSCMLLIMVLPSASSVVLVVAMIGRLGVTSVYGIVTLYTAELFPTEVRNSAVGLSSMCGHTGSMLAPFAVDFLGQVAWYVPTTICGAGLFGAALLVLLNPETKHSKLVDHVTAGEEQASKSN